MAQYSWLPAGGTNLFQDIKAKRAEAEAAGIKILNLAIGQPQGPALLSARQAAAAAVLSDSESMHEYQDNGSPGVPGFAPEFVQFHTGELSGSEVAYLPIPGIKSMLGLIPLACRCEDHPISVYTTTDPGYPTPKVWCEYLDLGRFHTALWLGPGNQFRFNPDRIHPECGQRTVVMMNYPHNPSGQVATRDWLRKLCEYCIDFRFVRIFNDAAYVGLKHTNECATLAEVAVHFPGLSWVEAFSASKIIGNGTGWRIGAMVGSPDFIADIARIKGNTDSGFAAPLAAGVLNAIRNDRVGITLLRQMYALRIKLLGDILKEQGMRLAVAPGAGFFTLWLAPKRAFGEFIQGAEHFNYLMIERTGVMGVHFHPYIRYAVVGDVSAMAEDIQNAFAQANVSYD